MSEAPESTRLLEIMNALHADGQVAQAEALFERALAAIARYLDGQPALCVYRVSGGSVLPWWPADSTPPGESPALADAITRLQAAVEDARWLLPLAADGRCLAVLEIDFRQDAPAAIPDWVHVAAHQLANALATWTMRDLMDRQAKTATELTACTTFREMAAVIAKHMLSTGQFVSINLARYDESGAYVGFDVIATANRRESFEAGESLDITLDELGDYMGGAQQEGAPVLIDDPENLPPKLRVWLAQFKIVSLCTLPMLAMGRTFGFIGINGTSGPLHLSPPELEAYQSLSDQVSSLVRLHRLTEEASRSQMLRERLSHALNDLEIGQDFSAMAAGIARHMLPEQGRYLAIVELDHDPDGNIAAWQVLASANRNQSYHVEEPFVVPWEQIRLPLREAIAAGQPFVLNDMQTAPESTGQQAADWFAANRIQGFLALPMLIEGRPFALLAVMSRSKPPFSSEEVGLFQRLADQIGVLVHARQLLQQSQSAHDLASNLIEANRRILMAEDFSDIVSVTIGALPELITHVGLFLFEPPVTVEETPTGVVLTALASRGGTVQPNIVDQPNPAEPHVMALLRDMFSGEMRVFEDITLDQPALIPNAMAYFLRQRINALTGIGLRAGPRLLGLLVFGSTHRLPAEGQAVDTVRAVASQVELVLQNRQLLRDSQRRADQLQYIATFSQSVQATLDDKSIYEVAMVECNRMMQLDYMGITLYDSARAQLQLVAQYEDGKTWVRSTGGPLVAREGTTAGRVWQTRTLLHVPDLQQEADLRHPLKKELRSLVVAPIFARGLMLGMAEAGCESPYVYNETDLIVFQQMVNQLAVALENATAYAQSQQLAKNKALVGEIAAQLQQQTDMESILNVTLGELGKALGARRGRIRLARPDAMKLS